MKSSDMRIRKGGRLGPFRLGRRLKSPAEPELGRIYQAHNLRTGVPALVVNPGPRPTWKPGGPWQVRAYSQGAPPFIALEVERAPASGRLPELADILDLLSISVEQVEKDATLRAHLTRSQVGWLKRWAARARPLFSSFSKLAGSGAGLAVLALCGGLWWSSRAGPGASPDSKRWVANSDMSAPSATDATHLINSPFQGASVIAYPLPDKPFRNQAKMPCLTERDEVEINGGCWMALERRPPCHKDQAEYLGKCYLPISKDRGPREPQALQP